MSLPLSKGRRWRGGLGAHGPQPAYGLSASGLEPTKIRKILETCWQQVKGEVKKPIYPKNRFDEQRTNCSALGGAVAYPRYIYNG